MNIGERNGINDDEIASLTIYDAKAKATNIYSYTWQPLFKYASLRFSFVVFGSDTN